jgi:hypothetical protein
MAPETLLHIYSSIDTELKDPTNCFQTSRAYLKSRNIDCDTNMSKLISDPRGFSSYKDIYHVEIFDKNTIGHSFLLVRTKSNTYRLCQSFQNEYTFRVEPETYTWEEVNTLLKTIASFKTFNKTVVEFMRKLTKIPHFDFNLCEGEECWDCGYIYNRWRLFVVIREY